MSSAQCQTAAANAIVSLDQDALTHLSALKDALAAPTPDKTGILADLSELGKSFIPPALAAVIEALVKSRL